MAHATLDEPGRAEFERWMEPFLGALGNKKRRLWAPLYVRGLILPGERKSMERVAERVAPDDVQQLNHFVATSPWALEPVETVLWEKADAMVGGQDAVLIIDDTALIKQGRHSVGVAHQYCGQLGKNANCQSMVSLTLARNEVPVTIGLHLYMPESWTSDPARMRDAGVPAEIVFRKKWQIALEQVERVHAAGLRFGIVLADAGYGMCAEFRQGLSELGLTWSMGIMPTQLVYRSSVKLRPPTKRVGSGPQARYPVPSERPLSVEELIASLGPRAFRSISWRMGTKGKMQCEFAATRVRPAKSANLDRKQLPGEEVWLVCERRSADVMKYYFSNQPPAVSLKALAATIKARWSCEQGHQQLKEELGLDHFEGRSWLGLHHHALLAMIAYAYLQRLRLKRKKNS